MLAPLHPLLKRTLASRVEPIVDVLAVAHDVHRPAVAAARRGVVSVDVLVRLGGLRVGLIASGSGHRP